MQLSRTEGLGVSEEQLAHSDGAVIATDGFGRNTCIRRGGDTALMDGDVACLAGTRRDAGRSDLDVHDPPGLLLLRRARSAAVAAGFGRGPVPAARDLYRRLIPASCARLLHH